MEVLWNILVYSVIGIVWHWKNLVGVAGLTHPEAPHSSYAQLFPAGIGERVRRQIHTDALRSLFKAPCFGRVGFFEDPFSCSHYFHCMANGTHIRRTCIPPLQFSEERQMCMDPGTVDCPDLPDFWLAAAAAAAASPTGVPPSHAPPPAIPSVASPPHHNNPFLSSPLTFNSAPLAAPDHAHNFLHSGQHSSPFSSHPQASNHQPKTWPNQFAYNHDIKSAGQRPYAGSYGQQGPMVLSRSSPADPVPPALLNTQHSGSGQTQLRPMTVHQSAPLRAAFGPPYQGHVGHPALVENVQPAQTWLDLDNMSPVTAHNTAFNQVGQQHQQPPQQRYPNQGSLLEMRSAHAQAYTAPSNPFPQHAVDTQPQQHSSYSNLESQLARAFPQASPLNHAQPNTFMTGFSGGAGGASNAIPPNQDIGPVMSSLSVFNDSPAKMPSGPAETSPAVATTQTPVNTNPQVEAVSEATTCKHGEKGFFAELNAQCKGYYFCSPFGDRAEFTCPTGRFFNDKTISCEAFEKSTCWELSKHSLPSVNGFTDLDTSFSSHAQPPAQVDAVNEHPRPNPAPPEPGTAFHMQAPPPTEAAAPVVLSFMSPNTGPDASLHAATDTTEPKLVAHGHLDSPVFEPGVKLQAHGFLLGTQPEPDAPPSFIPAHPQPAPVPTGRALWNTAPAVQSISTEGLPALETHPTVSNLASATTAALKEFPTTLDHAHNIVIAHPDALPRLPVDPDSFSTFEAPLPTITEYFTSDKQSQRALEARLRSWNMANFSSPADLGQEPAAVDQNVPDPLIRDLQEQLLAPFAAAGKEQRADVALPSVLMSYFKARDVPPARPLRFADSRRTINLKLLMELLKG